MVLSGFEHLGGSSGNNRDTVRVDFDVRVSNGTHVSPFVDNDPLRMVIATAEANNSRSGSERTLVNILSAVIGFEPTV